MAGQKIYNAFIYKPDSSVVNYTVGEDCSSIEAYFENKIITITEYNGFKSSYVGFPFLVKWTQE